MGKSIKYITLGVLIIFCQILISEYVNIWPTLYIVILPIFLISLPGNINIMAYMLLAFALGLGIDSLSDGVLGLNAAACVAMAYFRRPVINIILTKNSIENMDSVSSQEIGIKKFTIISIFLYSIFFFVYIGLDNFGSLPLMFTLLRFSLNIAVNVIFALIVEVTLISRFSIKYRG